MRQKKILSLTLSQLRQLYGRELPELTALAGNSGDAAQFRDRLGQYITGQADEALGGQIRALLDYDGKTIHELSTGQDMEVRTISFLWEFLNGRPLPGATNTDLFLDLFFLLRQPEEMAVPKPSAARMKSRAERWATGLDGEVIKIRQENKNRMIDLLIRKIEAKKNVQSRFQFTPEMTYDEKHALVDRWWDDFRFQLSMAIKGPNELNRFLGNTLDEDTMQLLAKAKKKQIPFFVTPYYLSLLDTTGKGYDDKTVRSYIMYSPELVETYGNIHAWEKEDVVEEGKPNAAGWLLPKGHNIHRRYPEVAILIPDTMGRACGGLCASCQRMYDFQSERLNFELETLKPKESWDSKLRRLMNYFEEDSQLRDILVTGGDALMSQNKTLKNILDAIYKMAVRKRKANSNREPGEKYAELQRVRLGTRLPAYLPMRVNDDLVAILREFKEKASEVGVKQFIIQTHFQSPLEITPQAKEAIAKLLSAGWIITNQLVYTVAASRRGHTIRLRQFLNELGVVCYYTFSVKGFRENYAVYAPNSRSLQEEKEEKTAGRMTPVQQEELVALLEPGENIAGIIRKFVKKHRLPFLATDRNVLNLPGIGKSMTFATVGLTEEGKRILRFEHDPTRRHSPIIHKMGNIYIVENKSIAAYLRQLEQMGEDPEEYASIWTYTRGKTEARFRIYDYPELDYQVTERFSNLKLPDSNEAADGVSVYP